MAARGLPVVENLVQDKPVEFPISFKKIQERKKMGKKKEIGSQSMTLYMRACLFASPRTRDHHISACALRARTLKTTDEILTNEEAKCDLYRGQISRRTSEEEILLKSVEMIYSSAVQELRKEVRKRTKHVAFRRRGRQEAAMGATETAPEQEPKHPSADPGR